MSQFKGPNPSGQSRSLRSIAEGQNSAALFVHGTRLEQEQIVLPIVYDVAETARPTEGQARRGLTVADPMPFTNLKGR